MKQKSFKRISRRAAPSQMGLPNPNPSNEFEPTDAHWKMFLLTWAEAQTRQRLSSDNFDKGILNCSTAGLVISLAFTKDVVPLATAEWPSLLYFSWALFLAAIVVTMISFQVSFKASEINANESYNLYLHGIEVSSKKLGWRDRYIRWGNLVAASLFLFAAVITVFFVFINAIKAPEMKKPNIAQDGIPPGMLHKIPSVGHLQNGIPSGSLPRMPAPQKPSPQQPAVKPAGESKK